MAFDTNMVAISWHGGKYAIVGQIEAYMDNAVLENTGRFHDVSPLWGYLDRAAIFELNQLGRLLVSAGRDKHLKVINWLKSLPKEATFIMVQLSESSSGMGD